MTDWQDRFVERRTMTAGELATRYNRDNFRLHPETQKDAVEGSLDKLGFFDQIKFSSDGGVFDGHLRIELALDKYGPDYELPVDIYDLDATETQQALILKDQTAGMAEIDVPKFEAVWNEFQVDIPAFDDWVANEFEFGQNGAGEIVEDEPPIDKAAELQEKWGTQLGQLWQLGEHRLACGDCTDKAVVDAVMGGEEFLLLVTDPPYGVEYEGGCNPTQQPRKKLKGDSSADLYKRFIPILKNYRKKKGVLYIWFDGDRGGKPVYEAVENNGFDIRALIIWNKLDPHYGNFMAQYMQKHEPCLYCVKDGSEWYGPTNEVTVWDIKQSNKNEHHPTQKPMECMIRPIKNSTREGDLVVDPFLGSGTTLIACEQLNRKCRAIEIDPGYTAVAIERWHTLTGQEPKLIS